MAEAKMKASTFHQFDATRVPSPCFVVDEVALERNLKQLHAIQEASGAKVLLALKAFSMKRVGKLVAKYLSGTCASGLHEAKLGYEYFGGKDQHKEVHTFSAAFTENDLVEILKISHHVVFNSFSQWKRFKERCLNAQIERPELRFGLRVNPEHSEGTTPMYDPCAPCSRLGIPMSQIQGQDLSGISGLHFHTLCEQGFEPLSRTLAAVEQKLGDYLHEMEWINFGGGHHITDGEYDSSGLIRRIKGVREKYSIDVYLEPGEAIAIHTGVLVSEVLDTTYNDMNLAILDTSATCHMPDTLEMPYRANIFGASEADGKAHTYRLGGQTCLAGDVIGDYSFDDPLSVGQRLIFDDMAHYTMVKTTTFNGINLPSIALWNSETDQVEVVKTFGYDDFQARL